MQKAYDTFLLSEVTAVLVAKTGSYDAYRYECACCGEEVYLAAADNIDKVNHSQRKLPDPHFRHRTGNNDVKCEYYLGQFGAISTDANSRKSKSERAEFYFDYNTKLFYLGLKFNETELSFYEKHSAVFELRTSLQSQPFFSQHINGTKFMPDVQVLIPLDKFSNSYFLSNTLNGIEREYHVFNDTKNAPTFFKLHSGDRYTRAKLVRSSVLYTNISYLAVFQEQNQYWNPVNYSLPKEIRIENSFNFETMRIKFIGKVITIDSKAAQVEHMISSWGYQLETSETLTLLWPPAVLTDDLFTIDSASAYLYASFDLLPHGNINVHSADISIICDGLTKVTVNSRTKIYKKNAELIIENRAQDPDCCTEMFIDFQSAAEFQATDDSFFLFNHSGVANLSKGEIVQLTPNSHIMHYTQGYLDKVIKPQDSTTLSAEELIQDSLVYYKRQEPINWDDFESCDLSQTAFNYIDDCDKTGLINSATKLLITEGLV
jgi:hypothetical protein